VAREEYRPVATRGSLLYFLIVDMASINVMYQVSLQQFLALFDYSISNSAPAPLASKRIVNIIEYLNFHATCYMQRGLFERHKTIWTLMLAMRIESNSGKLSGNQQKMLLTGGGALDINTEKPKPFAWLPDNAWLNVLQLSRSVEVFRDLPDAITRNDAMWKHWYDEDSPESVRVPDFEDRLTSYFDKLLLVRSVREDRALLCVQEYIMESLGKQYVDSRPLDLKVLVDEADKFTCMIFLLSTGADPTGPITELARKRKKQVRAISMGQGQEPAARKLVTQGMMQGSWVLLQNCHLGLKMMNELEGTLLNKRANEPDEVMDEFRLWISAEPHPKFPIGLLQMSIKVTNEAPAGVRAGLKGSYAWLTQDHLDAITGPSQLTWRTMLYALCFMHTSVQERRKFGMLARYTRIHAQHTYTAHIHTHARICSS
jgi:dynein heavy chain